MASPWFDDLSIQEEDDCDEDDDNAEPWCSPDYCVIFSSEGEQSVPRKLLLLCFGATACCFGSSFLLEESGEKKEYARIVDKKDGRTHGRLCKFSEDVVVCVCDREVSPEASRTWTRKVRMVNLFAGHCFTYECLHLWLCVQLLL